MAAGARGAQPAGGHRAVDATVGGGASGHGTDSAVPSR